MAFPIFTLGHSTRPLPVFIDLLKAAEVTLLVDIRSIPRSRTNPQFNKDTLPQALARQHIDYRHLARLGGLRGKSATIAPDTNGFWHNDSFHHYADYALEAPFRAGLETLIRLADTRCCAIMCSETVWWRCHRRIVADHLIAHGLTVIHILDDQHRNPASLTPGARIREDRSVVYPAPAGPD